MNKLLKKSLKYTLLIHLVLIIIFMIGFFVDRKSYGDNYLNEGIYFNFLFLQFVPITFLIIFSSCLYSIGLVKEISLKLVLN